MRLLFAVLLVCGCSDPLPFKYEVCKWRETQSCEVRARFREWDACERYAWWTMNCCETPLEGQTHCGGTCQASLVEAHCTR